MPRGHPLKDPTTGKRLPVKALATSATHTLIAAYRAAHGGSQGEAIDTLVAAGAKALDGWFWSV